MHNHNHPVWGLLEKLMGCVLIIVVLYVLTLNNATSFDWELDGEAGTIGGTGLVGLMWFIFQWWKQDIYNRNKRDQETKEMIEEVVKKMKGSDKEAKKIMVELTESQVKRIKS